VSDIKYIIIRQKRKSVSIRILPDLTAEIKCPLLFPGSELKRVIAQKEKWIKEHMETVRERNENKSEFSLNYGDSVLIMAREYPIVSQKGNKVAFDGSKVIMPEGLDVEQIKRAMVKLYKITAKNVLTEKLAKYAKLMGLEPGSIKVNSAKKRWGSCSSSGNINFTWFLILADESSIDYVIVHELAHIIHLNHSDKFWAEVKKIIPEYKLCQNSLKVLQQRLANEDWE